MAEWIRLPAARRLHSPMTFLDGQVILRTMMPLIKRDGE
jgi:hypothetical protein